MGVKAGPNYKSFNVAETYCGEDIAFVIDTEIVTPGSTSFDLITSGTCTYIVDWGDDSSETVNATGTFTQSHNYSVAGVYTVKIEVVSGNFYPYYDNNANGDLIIKVRGKVDYIFSGDFSESFYGASNIDEFTVNLSGVTNLQNAFRGSSLVDYGRSEGAKLIESYPYDQLIDLSSCTLFGTNTNISNNAYGAWRDCTSLTSFPAADMSSATDIGWAWQGCSSMTDFGACNFGAGTYGAFSAWGNSGITTFPALDLSGATDLRWAWRNCTSMTTFGPTDMSNCILFGTSTNISNNAYGAWRDCTSLTSFPAADMSSATDIGWAWQGCSSLTSFSDAVTLPVGVGTYGAFYAWNNCTSLTTFPALDLSGATDLRGAWRNCTSMTTFGPTDMSNCTSFGTNTNISNNAYGAWRDCTSLTSFPAADMSSATDISWAWQGCSSMTDFGAVTLPVGVGTYGAFYAWGNSGITTFPALDLSGATDLRWAWYNCSSMTTFGPTNISNCTSFGTNTNISNIAYGAWRGCSSLTSFPAVDMSSGTDFGWAWRDCTSMTTFGLCDVSQGTNFGYAWNNCTSLTTFPANAFDTTGTLISSAFTNAWLNSALNAQSIENILVSLDTNGATGITLNISGGSNAAKTTWTSAANTAYTNLIGKSWTISYNA